MISEVSQRPSLFICCPQCQNGRCLLPALKGGRKGDFRLWWWLFNRLGQTNVPAYNPFWFSVSGRKSLWWPQDQLPYIAFPTNWISIQHRRFGYHEGNSPTESVFKSGCWVFLVVLGLTDVSPIRFFYKNWACFLISIQSCITLVRCARFDR